MAETGLIERSRIGIIAHPIQDIQKHGKGPFAVGVASDAAEPAFAEADAQGALDVLPGAEVAVVHPHQAVAVERVAVGVGERSLGGGAYVGEDKLRGRFGA